MSSHLSGGRINVAQVQELARKELLTLLGKCDGSKAIIWDESLVGLVSTIAQHSLLKEHDVDHMFVLTDGNLKATNVKNFIFITRPHQKLMDYIADHVHSEERRTGPQRKEFHIFFLPRKSMLCETRLKNRGVFGNFTGHVYEFSCDLFPFDSDVLSMEIETAFKELYLEEDPSCLYQVAQGLMTLQALFGPIARVSGQGRAARQVIDLLKRLRAEQGQEVTHSSGGIDHLLLIDRGVDLLSPLATQLTYEGLIDEVFGISNTKVTLPADKFSQSDEPSSSMLSAEKKIIVLNSAEELYAELRDKNFSAVGPALSRKARLISAEFEARHGQTVQQMKQFVARLPHMALAKQSLATHTTIAELIKEVTDAAPFLESLQLEQEFMNGIDTDKAHPYIEDLIAQKSPLIKVLRLICMQSVCNSGLKPKLLEYYKREIIQTYGFEHLLTLVNLEKAGLLKVQQSSRAFTVLRKTLRLVVHDSSETNPTDISYVHSVYAPLSARLAQHLVSRQGWRGVQDVLSVLPGPTIIDDTLQPSKHADALSSPQSEAPRVVLVFFLGGCTFAEISALRFLSQQEETPVEFVVATTKLINGNTFIKSLMEQLIPDKNTAK